ncbi:unnamed protein product [Clonostachys rosea]|uniref:Uncharacterized protein n=1 Tax=Bionectria ochroleuca TaxID=29856 RepID=A0ABY6TVW4_BIOOC|nr:unnamed protein product [Clonostachys rosea]
MADENCTIPPHEAPDGRPHPNDVGPFSSVTYSLARDGPDPQELNLKMCDRDMALSVEADKDHMLVLHLQNVRQDTFAEAKAAVDNFLGQMEPLADGDGPGGTVFERFREVYREMVQDVHLMLGDIEVFQDRISELDNADETYPKKAETSDQDYNPVAELIYASFEFADRIKEIKTKSKSHYDGARPKRNGLIVNSVTDLKAHGHLTDYMGEQGRKRNLRVAWKTANYSGDTQRIASIRPLYHVYIDEGKGWGHRMSEETVPQGYF